jgi:hypothetical protein
MKDPDKFTNFIIVLVMFLLIPIWLPLYLIILIVLTPDRSLK